MATVIDWRGDEEGQKMRRAATRAVVALAEYGVVQAKTYAHVLTGTLRRSIHSAPVEYEGYGDFGEAYAPDPADTNDIPNATEDDVTDINGAMRILFGSWLPYAAVEEVDRGHVYIQPAVEDIRGVATDIIAQAVAEEGLGQDGPASAGGILPGPSLPTGGL